MRPAAITLATILATSVTYGASMGEEAVKAGIYMLHSAAQGNCPPLDWHVVVKVDGTVAGVVSWDEMRSIAHVIGVVRSEDRAFHLYAKELRGEGLTAVIDGTIQDDGSLVMDIKGPNIDCRRVVVPRITMPDAG